MGALGAAVGSVVTGVVTSAGAGLLAGVLVAVSPVSEVLGELLVVELPEEGALVVCAGPVGCSQVPGVVTVCPALIERQYGA